MSDDEFDIFEEFSDLIEKEEVAEKVKKKEAIQIEIPPEMEVEEDEDYDIFDEFDDYFEEEFSKPIPTTQKPSTKPRVDVSPTPSVKVSKQEKTQYWLDLGDKWNSTYANFTPSKQDIENFYFNEGWFRESISPDKIDEKALELRENHNPLEVLRFFDAIGRPEPVKGYGKRIRCIFKRNPEANIGREYPRPTDTFTIDEREMEFRLRLLAFETNEWGLYEDRYCDYEDRLKDLSEEEYFAIPEWARKSEFLPLFIDERGVSMPYSMKYEGEKKK